MEEKTIELFDKFLSLSNFLRKNYKESIGYNQLNDVSLAKIPETLKGIYSIVKGTEYEVKDQSLMDFLPGFLLIHINEYEDFYLKLNNIIRDKDKNNFFPILVNYSSDFYALCKSDLGIYLIFHDNNMPIKVHNSFKDFIITLIEFYKQKVYFLDNDGYLDMDFEKEELITQNLNPDIKYWHED